jgi:hypothetical protein
MKNSFMTTTVTLAVFLFAVTTGFSQDTKKVEKKTVIVTVADDGVTKDTTLIEGDTVKFEGGNLIIETRDGRKIIRKPGVGSRMVWAGNTGYFPGQAAAPGVFPGRALNRAQEEDEGVSYHISVDGVVVNIRAPKEKTKEADQILSEVKKILMKK